MYKNSFKSDLQISLIIIWLIFSTIFLSILVSSFLFPSQVLSTAPVCVSKIINGDECYMCGTTRAFTEISKGSFVNALRLNQFSIILYFIFLINSVLFFIYLIITVKSKYSITLTQNTNIN
ncbi:MAG: DUF2752 domain-containing protein [Ignavibacteria bacterium]|nr:DUF2752 domain-containing protein [Ignavibacteria bacterium]